MGDGTGVLGRGARRVDRRSEQPWHWATVVDSCLLVAGIAAVLVLCWPWLTAMATPLALLSGTNLVVLVIGFLRGFRPVLRPAQLICFGFLLPYLGVAPIYQMGTRSAAWGDIGLMSSGNLPDLTRAMTIVLVGDLALLLGMLWFARRTTWHDDQERRPALRLRHVEPWLLLPWVFLAAAAVLLPRSVEIVGGFDNLFENRYDAAARLAAQGVTLQDAGGTQVALVNLLPASLALAAAYLLLVRLIHRVRERRLRWFHAIDVLGVLAATGLALVFANPLANSRFTFVYVAGALAMLVLRPRRAWAGALLAVLTLTVTLVAYPLANVFRTDMEVSAGVAAFATPDFDGFQQVVNTGPFVDRFGHSDGRYVLSAIGYVVPRSVWPDKAYPASEQVAELRGYVFTNLSLPIHAELYLEGGYAALVLAMLVIGLLVGRVDRAWAYAPETRAGLVAPLVALAMLGLMRGPLGANIPIYGTALALVLVSLHSRRMLAPARDAGRHRGSRRPSDDDPPSGVAQAASGRFGVEGAGALVSSRSSRPRSAVG